MLKRNPNKQHKHIYIYRYVCIWIYTYIYLYKNTCVFLCIYRFLIEYALCVCVCLRHCVSVHICVFIYTYTYLSCVVTWLIHMGQDSFIWDSFIYIYIYISILCSGMAYSYGTRLIHMGLIHMGGHAAIIWDMIHLCWTRRTHMGHDRSKTWKPCAWCTQAPNTTRSYGTRLFHMGHAVFFHMGHGSFVLWK